MSLAAAATQLSFAFAQNLSEAYSEASMNSRVIISRPGVALYNETTREYAAPITVTIYDELDELGAFTGLGAKAGITLTGASSSYSVGDEPTYYSPMTCYLPNVVPITPRIDDVVKVISNVDLDMVGRQFRIMDVPAGGRLSTSTDLSCIGISPSRQWGQS